MLTVGGPEENDTRKSMQIKLRVFDQDGDTYEIPAEVVESPFKGHQFAVHKSISLGDNHWVISHVASGMSVLTAGLKETAVHALSGRLKGMTAARLAEVVAEAIEMRTALTKSR
jgi:hypothetical protein